MYTCHLMHTSYSIGEQPFNFQGWLWGFVFLSQNTFIKFFNAIDQIFFQYLTPQMYKVWRKLGFMSYFSNQIGEHNPTLTHTPIPH